MAQTQAQYINKNLKRLANYINHLADFNKKYNEGIKDLCSKSKAGNITKSENTIKYEKEIKESYNKTMELYNDLKRIADKYRNRMNIDSDLQWFHNRLNSARLPIYEKATLKLTTSEQDGVPTGGAAMPTSPSKADFSDMAKFDIYMKTNNWLNKNNPDAQELANIFLASPRRAPESEEYKYIPPSSSCILNSKYNLQGNKKIDNFWSGFAYSKYSTLAKNVSNYADLKNQLVKHYNSNTGQFDADKIDVNFDNDKNLHLALGHATILEPAIDEKGYFHGILFDKYDFELMSSDKEIYKSLFTILANNLFWGIQQRHPYKNFYILAPVTFKW